MTVNKDLAVKLASIGSAHIGHCGDDVLRDWLDMKTGSELDCTKLDVLTKMVRAEHREYHSSDAA